MTETTCKKCGQTESILKTFGGKEVFICTNCVVQEIKLENDKTRMYKDSPRFLEIYTKIVKWLDENNKHCLCDNEYQEPLFYDISNAEYWEWCSAATIDQKYTTEKEDVFMTEYYAYKDLIISYTHGQGTLLSIIKKEWELQ